MVGVYNNFVPKIDYQLIRSKKLTGNITLRIKDGAVVVRAPFWVPMFAIQNFVDQKSSWIIKNMSAVYPSTPSKSYEDGEKHLFFGKDLPLKIVSTPTPQRTSIQDKGEHLEVSIYSGFSSAKIKQEIKDALLRFYLEEGVGYITEKVNYYTNLLGVDYSKIDIKKVSSIWGSCSGKNVLSFNRKLIMAPYEIIDYVVIHEVCHLRERNHSSRFWGLVFKYDREYKIHRGWLSKNHKLLTI